MYPSLMRTTVNLDDDVAAALTALRSERSLTLSEAVNQAVREGLARPTARARFHQRSADLGIRVDVSNIGDVLDALDES